METVRLIHYSNEDGSCEGVYFTDDLKMDASDACPYGCTVKSDQQIEMDTSGFPMNYDLRRE